MKTCVFIIGGNLAGKSTLARALALRFGGLDKVSNLITLCRENCCLAGKYTPDSLHGGVDRLGGGGKTSLLADAVKQGFSLKDTIIAEGSYMDTFGLNMTNAMFLAQRHLVVHLYCDLNTLQERQKLRPNHYGRWQTIINKHLRIHRVAQKWKEVGVTVKKYDTGVTPVNAIADDIIKFIEQ